MSSYRVRKLVNADKQLHDVTIHVENREFAALQPSGEDSSGPRHAPPGTSGEYAYAVPGLIDIHTHGALGHDLMDGTDEAFHSIAEFHLSNGTTSFIGSTLTSPLAVIHEFLRGVRPRMDENARLAASGSEAHLAGIHLEGPWISTRNLGAQNAKHVIEPDTESFRIVEENADIVKMVTFSYHTPGAERFLELLVRLGIVPASGHDEAVDEDIVRAFERGMSHLTHIYSNSSSFQRKNRYKHLGSLEMALITPGVSVEVIADDRHITRYFWDFITHNKNADNIMVVSDSTRGAGLPEDPAKVYELGGMDMVIDDGVAWLSDRSVFAGSTSTMLRMFRVLVRDWGVSVQDAVRMTSHNQASKFGLTEVLGGIAPGRRADMLLFDDDLRLQRIVKSGHEVEVPSNAN
jgi:N-acetylglucosamine-6-phosphate deacetylase